MANEISRQYMKEKHVFQWEVAKALGISEPTFIRWLREELSPEMTEKLRVTVDQIAKEKEED